jgi:hypothetical protein
MTITTVAALTGSGCATGTGARPTTKVTLEATGPPRDTSAPLAPLERRLPAYYLGRPAHVWIDAMSPRATSRLLSPQDIGRG